MARLNIYVPDDLAPVIDRWRHRVNLSDVCARALRETLQSLDHERAMGPLLKHLGGPTPLERAVARRWKLRRVVVAPETADIDEPREPIAIASASLLDEVLADGMLFAVAGGRQMWTMVRRMAPRSLAVHLMALGSGQVDPSVLHAHPNTLVTILSLLYAPRASAALVGAAEIGTLTDHSRKDASATRRVIVGSCSPFDRNSSYARLLEPKSVSALAKRRAKGDCIGVFLDARGAILDTEPPDHASLLTGDQLESNAKRKDTLVILAAGGAEKRDMIRLSVAAGLCNTLVTDEPTALALSR
jgi:DNA-binding transcriptional regulator LsrR (DeoR family)